MKLRDGIVILGLGITGCDSCDADLSTQTGRNAFCDGLAGGAIRHNPLGCYRIEDETRNAACYSEQEVLRKEIVDRCLRIHEEANKK